LNQRWGVIKAKALNYVVELAIVPASCIVHRVKKEIYMFKKPVLPVRAYVCLACAVMSVILCHAASASTWHIEAVDAPKYFERSSIKVDAGGTVHIAYGGDHLYYATYDGSAWSYQTVDSNPSVGAYASLALDRSGKAHISYYDDTNDGPKYATNASGAWVTSTVDSSEGVGRGTSIALDSSGKVHISYYDSTNDVFKYATNAYGMWLTTTIDSSTGDYYEYYSSIALDVSGNVYISYHDRLGTALKYATNASGSWATTTVDSDGDVGAYNSIAVDDSGKAHISYYDNTYSTLKYATNASGSWVTTMVDVSSGNTSIALDDSGKVHISYINFGVKYATNVSGAWLTSTVETGGGGSTSLALDDSGKAHISYFDDTNDDLKYATNATGSWVTTKVDSSGNVGWSSSMALDDSGKVHISYYDRQGNVLKYATNASGSWTATTATVFSSGYIYSTSIAVDDSGKAHISYYGTNSDLKYATNASGSWVTTTVDSKGDVGWSSSIALDDKGRVHISYYDDTNNDLKYATNASGRWVTKKVDSKGNVGYYSSITVDDSGKAHISYCDETNEDLKYATNASGKWVTKKVNSKGEYVWYYSSIAIDNSDKVHISYVGDAKNSDNLKYATNVSGRWVTKRVTSDVTLNGYPSIALDSEGRVHIGYYNQSGGLNYATNASGSWVTTSVDSNRSRYGYTPLYNSIAVDSDGNVHISYFDYSNYDLKYATNAEVGTDTTAPVGSVSIFNESYTNSATISLILTATDDSGITGYYLSESSSIPSASASGWTAVTETTSYSESVSFTLSSGDGTKNIYGWFKDEAGNVSTTASTSITLDTTNGQATPTPTPATSPTPTPVTSPSPTTTPSPTPTSTPTPTPTPSATPTPTPAAGGSAIVFGFVRNAEEVQMWEVTITISSIVDGSSQSTETDTRGMYVFRGLAEGSYTITYEREGYQGQTVTISLDEGEIEEIDDIIMEEVVKGKIWGYVKDIHGDPVESVILQLEGLQTGITDSDSSDKDGFFEITNLDADTYTIIAWKKRYRQATKTVTIGDGESKEIEFEMRRTTKRIKKLNYIPSETFSPPLMGGVRGGWSSFFLSPPPSLPHQGGGTKD
jgi:hypothetical protein